MNTRTRAALALTTAGFILAATAAPATAANLPEITLLDAKNHLEAKTPVFSMTAEDYDAKFGSCQTLSTYDREAHGYEEPYADFLTEPGGGTVVPYYRGGEGSAEGDTVRYGPEQDGYVLVSQLGPYSPAEGWSEQGSLIQFKGAWVLKDHLAEPSEWAPDDEWCGSATDAAAMRQSEVEAEQEEDDLAEETEGAETPAAAPGDDTTPPTAIEPETTSGVGGPVVAISLIVAALAVVFGVWTMLRSRTKGGSTQA